MHDIYTCIFKILAKNYINVYFVCFVYMQILQEMKAITNKTDKEMDKLKSRAKKVVKGLEMMIPRKKLQKKVHIYILIKTSIQKRLIVIYDHA